MGVLVVQASLVAMLCFAATASARDVVVRSFDGTSILAHFFPAASLAADARVPTVLVGPGWAARGDTAPDANGGGRIGIANLRNDGYNVLTWDPRGFGASGGTAMFDSVAFEARDVQALIDYVAAQPEALLDSPGDPRVGMTGSSYGAAIQFVTAAIEPRLDAIVPDVAWHSLVDGFTRAGKFKAGWLLNICVLGDIYGLVDGVSAGFKSPIGVQLGSVDPRFRTMCLEGNLLGFLSAASVRWLGDLGPGALLDRVRIPTFITHGSVDTLFPPGQAVANYDVLRRNGVPVKMLWYCGGHGTCQTPPGDLALLPQTGLTWLRRWLKRDVSVDTGPRFSWVDQTGVVRSGEDYPLAPAGALAASGAGAMTLGPVVNLALSSLLLGTPALPGMVEARYTRPAAETDVVGEPALTLSYDGFALPGSTLVYARVLDASTGIVAGGQSTPVPVVLDGRAHTVTLKLEALALRVRPSSELRIQIVPSAPVYGPQLAIGTLRVRSLTSTLPLVDAARSARPAAR